MMGASGHVAPPSRGRETCPNKCPIRVVREAIIDLSGIMARVKAVWKGHVQPGTLKAEPRPYWLSSLHLVQKLDTEDLAKRLSYRAACYGLIKEEKGRVELREMFSINVGGVLGLVCCGSGVDGGCLSVGNKRRYGHGTVIGHG